jgi:transcriptional regulator with XRE-family HTH domain
MHMITCLAANIRRLRLERGLTQDALTRSIGVTSLKMIETGRIATPRYSTLTAIAKALGVTVSDLFAEPKPERRRKTTVEHHVDDSASRSVRNPRQSKRNRARAVARETT